MHSPLLLAVVLTVSFAVIPVNSFCPCPLCPVIVAAAAGGGLSTGSAILAGVSALASLPFAVMFLDSFRTKNMTFEIRNGSFSYPQTGQIIYVNESNDLYMNTFGLDSEFKPRTGTYLSSVQ
jgi:hypothetical protein